jgi:hypothetical protein
MPVHIGKPATRTEYLHRQLDTHVLRSSFSVFQILPNCLARYKRWASSSKLFLRLCFSVVRGFLWRRGDKALTKICLASWKAFDARSLLMICFLWCLRFLGFGFPELNSDDATIMASNRQLQPQPSFRCH